VATRQLTKEELTFPDCGYVAKAPQGLSSHQRSNGHGPYRTRPKTTRKKTGRRRKKTTARKTTARKTTARKTTARVGAARTTPLSQALRATRRAAEKERAQLLDRVEQLDGMIQQIDSMNF
jgi:hypothetical protein